MEYFLLIIVQSLGIGFNVMQTISKLDAAYPLVTKKEVIDLFWKEDWDSLIVSGLVMFSHLTFHFISDYYQAPYTEYEYYVLFEFGLALVLGYGGQRIAYKVLGTAEKAINNKIDNADKKL